MPALLRDRRDSSAKVESRRQAASESHAPVICPAAVIKALRTLRRAGVPGLSGEPAGAAIFQKYGSLPNSVIRRRHAKGRR